MDVVRHKPLVFCFLSLMCKKEICIYLAARSSTVVVVVLSRDWSKDSSKGRWES